MAGSSRKESVNKILALNALEIAKNLGADTTFIDLKNYLLPIFNGDLESTSGMPKNAQELKRIFDQHYGIFIASP